MSITHVSTIRVVKDTTEKYPQYEFAISPYESNENTVTDFFNIRLSIISLFKKFNGGFKMLPLCKLVYQYVKPYNLMYNDVIAFKDLRTFASPYSIEDRPYIRASIKALSKFVDEHINNIPYDILEKIVYHRPKILHNEDIPIDINFIKLISPKVSVLEERIGYLSSDLQMEIIKHKPKMIKYIERPSNDLIMVAITLDISVFRMIRNPSEDVIIKAVTLNPYLLKIIDNQTDSICMAALKVDINSYKHIRNPLDSIIEFYNKQTN